MNHKSFVLGFLTGVVGTFGLLLAITAAIFGTEDPDDLYEPQPLVLRLKYNHKM